MPQFVHIPAELCQRTQWVVYRLVLRNGRWTKAPYSPSTRRLAKTNARQTWATFEQAVACYSPGGFDGIGFVFARDDPYAGIDLDSCRDPATGAIATWARRIIDELDSYAEVSPSGTGVKIIARGLLPCPGTGRRRQVKQPSSSAGKHAEIEMYHFGRYFALTGVRVDGTPPTIEQRDVELTACWGGFFGSTLCRRNDCRQRTPAQLPAESRSDAQLLDRAHKARNSALFSRLFDAGCLDAYDGDHSRGDLALCGMLAFWTNGDSARIDRLFRRSALMRTKWDERHAADGATYGEMTIRKAVGG